MSNIDKRALREAAEKATPGPWYVHDKPCEDGNYGIDTSDKEFLAEAVVWWGFSRQSIWREEDAKHIAAANPATVLALLDELEAKDKLNAELMEKQRLIDICQGQGLEHRIAAEKRAEAAEKRIAELEAREIKPVNGEVLVTVAGFTGCGKSAIAGEIEIAMKAIGVPVQWVNGDTEKRMTGADWLTAIEMYKPSVRIIEVNVPRAAAAGKGDAS